MHATPLVPQPTDRPRSVRTLRASRLGATTQRTHAPRRRRVRRLPRRHVDLVSRRPVARHAVSRDALNRPVANRERRSGIGLGGHAGRPQRISLAAARRRRRIVIAAALIAGVLGCGALNDAFFAGSDGPAAVAPREALAR